ncbi:hypothetical protein PI87_27905 [Ralstonia sp. A12]|uniref:hypothetical protein n=1 Tax=Ralstonia sp. A12 TaxID=1217052 RepID=UPI0005732B46|nr:hypothetical protein [Ralstonia sp. A12]KHK48493.1 hypothetical protein PI87_27905 [Ralstonia sp. A12]
MPREIEQKSLPVLVNRTKEIGGLLELMPPRNPNAAFVILMAASGYGKTSLTSRLIELLRAEGIAAVALEPQVRAKGTAVNVYQGFYIQRCAESLDRYIQQHPAKDVAMTFEAFLKSERVQRTKSLKWTKFLRSVPGRKVIYEAGVELFDRFFGTGNHSADKVLTSDSREAVDTCARYVKHVVSSNRTVLVVREAQHIDHSSLQLLAEIAGPHSLNSAILEYTLEKSGAPLNTLYGDFIEAVSLAGAEWLHIRELVRLSKPHLEELLRQAIPGACDISGEYYLSWDGNVRAIRQLRFSISVEHTRGVPKLLDLESGVVDEYRRQIAGMAAMERMCLCLMFAHGEAIPRALIRVLLGKLNALATLGAVDLSLAVLVDAELATIHAGDLLGVENEDVAEAIRTQTSLAGTLLLAKAALRDHYRQLAIGAPDVTSGMPVAVRQALRLSVELNDVATMEELVALLSSRVSTTADQSWYVTQIVTAINGNARLFAGQQDRLLLWAAELAAEIADCRTARDLLRQVSSKSMFSDVLLCACLIETGDHDEATALTEHLIASAHPDERLAGQLIQLIQLRCMGRIDAARELWNALTPLEELHSSNLYGYLLRFRELVSDFPECIDDLVAASSWFHARGLATSSAYTLLTLASHVARSGEIQAAYECIDQARALLASTARDQHILANNEVAVQLLSESPEPLACCDTLTRVISGSGDDYSDIVLYTNLGISAALAQRDELAREAFERALRIARAPEFADRDVFWGVSFNLRYIDRVLALGRTAEIDEVFNGLRPHSLQDDYWRYRVGRVASVPERFQYMLQKPYHPMFLSHWTLDVDGLQTLKSAHEPEPPSSSTQSA